MSKWKSVAESILAKRGTPPTAKTDETLTINPKTGVEGTAKTDETPPNNWKRWGGALTKPTKPRFHLHSMSSVLRTCKTCEEVNLAIAWMQSEFEIDCDDPKCVGRLIEWPADGLEVHRMVDTYNRYLALCGHNYDAADFVVDLELASARKYPSKVN